MSTITFCSDSYKTYLNYYLVKEQERVNRSIKGRDFCKYLESNNIDYKLCIRHPETMGCDESLNYYTRFSDYLDFDYSICKHILVSERKGEKRNYLIIVDKDKKVDLSSIREYLDCKKLEFVSDDKMEELLDTYAGNVSIFNMINDHDAKVNLVMDKCLLKKEALAFHPLYNGMTLFISPLNINKFLNQIKEKPIIIDVPERKRENVKIKKIN